ncbi:MAG: LLM class flavin-dependent oxidoreductase [Myxococcota bacterium]
MRLSCALVPSPDVGDLAALAERLGYDRVWLADSPALYGDVWIAVAEAARATRRIGLGTSVLIPSLRHVVATAAAVAHVEAIAPGRLRLAFGTGFTGRRMLGKKALSLRTLEAYVRQLRALLAGEEVEVDGAICRLMHPQGVTASLPLRTPIWIAANGAKGLALARQVADGVICAGVVPPGVKDAAVLAMGTVLHEGETLGSPAVLERIGPAIAVIWHGTYEAAGAGVDDLPGGKGWRAEAERFPEASRHLYVHEGHLVELTERDRRNLAPELAGATFSGSPAQLRERAAGLEAQGIGEIVYWPMGPDLAGELEQMRRAMA